MVTSCVNSPSHRYSADVRLLLQAEEAEKFDNAAEREALVTVFTEFIKRISPNMLGPTDRRWPK